MADLRELCAHARDAVATLADALEQARASSPHADRNHEMSWAEQGAQAAEWALSVAAADSEANTVPETAQ